MPSTCFWQIFLIAENKANGINTQHAYYCCPCQDEMFPRWLGIVNRIMLLAEGVVGLLGQNRDTTHVWEQLEEGWKFEYHIEAVAKP